MDNLEVRIKPTCIKPTLHLIPTSHLIQASFWHIKKLKEVGDWCQIG